MTSSSRTVRANILTVDLEEWFHANFEGCGHDETRHCEVRVVENTKRLLGLLQERGARATFFVLGSVAEDHPDLIREVSDAGHALAIHGYGHHLVYNQTRETFREDVTRARTIVEGITGRPVKGYRAPSWSIREDSLWALEELDDLGFAYDSSVFPIKTYLYGMPSAPRFPYHPVVGGRTLDLVEVPASTVRVLGRNLPFAGGFYFRALPSLLIERGMRAVNREGQPAVVYLHPRELDPEQPRLELGARDRFVYYHGLRSCEAKLASILRRSAFTTIEDHLGI